MKINRIPLYLALFFCIAPLAHAEDITFKHDKLSIKTATAEQPFSIEIAETTPQMELGLMNRPSIPADHGMLFLQPKEVPMVMWMKNTLISLDMLFIDTHGKIIYIAANTTPESTALINPGQPVRAVIELAGGVAAAKGIKVGDHVLYPAFTQ